MEKTVKQRLVEFINHKGISQGRFERMCNLSNGYVNNLKKSIGVEKMHSIAQAFPELNIEWLLREEGSMLKPQHSPHVAQSNFFGNNNYINGNNYTGEDLPCVEGEEVTGAPVISSTLARASEVCVLEKVEECQERLEKSTTVVSDMDIAAWYPVRDTAMVPFYYPGDRLAICPFPEGHANPRPGVKYVVQTKSNGMFASVLFPLDNGDLRAHFLNSEQYPDYIVKHDDIVGIFRILMMTRI